MTAEGRSILVVDLDERADDRVRELYEVIVWLWARL
ncbi:hypothetical protein MPNT_300005 [Candidatus Methylacidithermus pantelleriae]|uniref:Uncharacterized protein n=1 Tax=Candidatus Methylacidithermus pantelleriae TaxID=2744239 RepID=A0A8J2BPM9_9BACT|nr:hypothetical protein MPNT_300005 [Candidatus Methylacidithermus pantelleriae]